MPDSDSPRPGARRVVVTGSTGLIGSALVDSLRADGVEVTRLVRRPAEASDEVEWLTGASPLDPAVLDGAAAVVGLNGATIGRFPWTARYKNTLLWSRVTPTQAIARALRELGTDAPAFVCASAVGYYGSAPRRRLDETSPRGETFLADLCGEWETAARAAGDQTRVALLRTAPIVHADGVLKPLMLLTRLGVSEVFDLRSEAELARDGIGPYASTRARHHHVPLVKRSLSPFDPDIDWRTINLRDRYIEMLDEGGAAIRAIFTALAEPRARPIVFHCSGGKDRTGVVAALIQRSLGVSDDVIRAALASFSGVKRRFSRVGDWQGVAVYDDYAHHPVEIAAVLRAARMAGKGRIVAVMQPHRYTRLQSLFNEFSACLDDADVAVVTPVYSAGEAPIPGIDRDEFANGLRRHGHPQVLTVDDQDGLVEAIGSIAKPGDLLEVRL